MIRAASVENDEDEERLLEEQLARYGRDRNVETSCVHYQSAEAFLENGILTFKFTRKQSAAQHKLTIK